MRLARSRLERQKSSSADRLPERSVWSFHGDLRGRLLFANTADGAACDEGFHGANRLGALQTGEGGCGGFGAATRRVARPLRFTCAALRLFELVLRGCNCFARP